MNCPKTMTNGRISLTKHPLHKESLAPFPITSKTSISPFLHFHLSFHRSKSTEKPEYVLSRANFNGQSTETPDSVLSKALSMTKAQNQTILCFRNSYRDNYGLLTGNARPECIQTDINFLVSTVNLFDIADYAGSFG